MTTKKPTPKPTPDERKPRRDVPFSPPPAVASDHVLILDAPVACVCCGNTKHPPAPCACCGN